MPRRIVHPEDHQGVQRGGPHVPIRIIQKIPYFGDVFLGRLLLEGVNRRDPLRGLSVAGGTQESQKTHSKKYVAGRTARPYMNHTHKHMMDRRHAYSLC